MDDLILEKNLKETLNKKSEEIGGSLADQRIRTRVFEAIEEEKNMKHRNWKKTVVAAAAICILGTMTAVAVGRPAFILSGSSRNEIVRDYDQAVQMQEGYDGRVKSVEGFPTVIPLRRQSPSMRRPRMKGKTVWTRACPWHLPMKRRGWRTWSFPEAASLWGCRTKALRIRS